MTKQVKRSITIEDVARTAGVSRAAVSKVIRDAYGVSDKMRVRVEAAISELDYRPRISARGMRGSTYTFGLEIPSITNQFFPKIIVGAAQALASSPYQLIVAPAVPEDDGYQAIQALADRQVDGLVTITRVPCPWLEDLGKRLPMVALGRHYESINYDTLVADDFAGAGLAVRHMYELGHRRIVHITLDEWKDEANSGASHSVRVIGYQQAVADCGVVPEILWVGASQNAARDAARALLEEADGPVGFFVAHDELALGVLEAVAAMRLTPGQASVVGFDDIDLAAHPLISLTSINQSGTTMGAIAVRLLRERIAGRTEAVHEVVAPRLMVRNSSAAPTPRTDRSHR